EIGKIDFPFLDHGQARGGFWHTFEDEPLHVGHLAPVGLVRLHHNLNPWSLADKLVGPQTDRTLLKGVISHLFDVLLGYDPGRPGGECAIIGQEIGPGRVQMKTHAIWINDFNLAELVALLLRPSVAQKTKFHILRREWVAIVKFESLTQFELV